MVDVEARLASSHLEELAVRLGFRGQDVPDVLTVTDRALAEGRAPDVARLAELVVSRIGGFLDASEPDVDLWDDEAARSTAYGPGALPMLALMATAPDVVAFHRSRGIDEDVSWGSLADLGQQVWVHRQTYGEFGLHTQGWLRIAWSGALLWLGRLQFNLHRGPTADQEAHWMLSTHIPQSGPLSPAAVDDAFARAPAVFSRAFPEHPTRQLHCASWLLDPQLGEVLPAESNLARFQARWTRYGEPTLGDDDVMFFVFRRRGPVDIDELPQRTTLERAVVGRLRDGGHWWVWNGLISQDGAGG